MGNVVTQQLAISKITPDGAAHDADRARTPIGVAQDEAPDRDGSDHCDFDRTGTKLHF